jgi:hypothetical protein
MSANTSKNRLLPAVAILLTWSIVLRIVVFLLLPPVKGIEQYSYTDILFFSALTDHFSDYISHSILIPPASHVINALVLFAFGIKQALYLRGFVIMSAVMDMAAVVFLFSAAKKAGAGTKRTLLVLCLFSAVLIPFELWREGIHYDHHTILFTSFFAWSLITLIKDPGSYLNMLWVSLAGGLLVSQSAVNAAIVPFSLLLILSLIYIPGRNFVRLGISLLITFFLPVLFLLVISKKNKDIGQETLTSNKGGPAMMMVVQRAYNYDEAKVRSLIQECGAPEYYLWAYDHASYLTDKPSGKPDEKLFHTLCQAFGVCYFSESAVGKTGPFGFDFHPLLDHLRQNDSVAMFTRFVEADSVNEMSRPYRLAGYSPELSTAWIGIYGDVSKTIYFKTLLKNPAGMFKSFIVQQGIFSIYGPLFPYNTMKKKTNLLVRSGLRTIPGKMPLDFLFTCFVLLYAVIAWLTYGSTLLNLPFALIRWLGNKKQLIQLSQNYFLLMSIPVLLVALVFSCLVGGENDRYFMQLSPYIILQAAILPGYYRTIRKGLHKSNRHIL